jgi:hypothetical protein
VYAVLELEEAEEDLAARKLETHRDPFQKIQ